MTDRHGGMYHVVRPDQVYRTGVWPTIFGFDPTADVMTTVNTFTNQGTSFMQGGLAGPRVKLLGGPPIQFLGRGMGFSLTSWLQGLWMRIKMGYAKLKMKLVGPKTGLGNPGPAGNFYPYGPKSWAGQEVVPFADHRAYLLAQMGNSHLPGQFSAIAEIGPDLAPGFLASNSR